MSTSAVAWDVKIFVLTECLCSEHLPTKLHVIDSLLEKYATKLSEIVEKVEEKYNTPPSSAADLMKQNQRMKGARALVQQKSLIAKSWALWFDDMRAGIPTKLWPLPGEVLPPPTADLPSGGGNVRYERGGAKEWLAISWEAWRAEPPAFFTAKWQHAIPAHFLPEGVELDEVIEGAEAEEVAIEVIFHHFSSLSFTFGFSSLFRHVLLVFHHVFIMFSCFFHHFPSIRRGSSVVIFTHHFDIMFCIILISFFVSPGESLRRSSGRPASLGVVEDIPG